MYSTCLFCNTSLGSNEAVEHFPVGRRLAFDAAKGRLWAVCRKCERWNLTPIEERWEAIEECERSFRATKLRVSTDQIGLGRIKEGLELVRIGKPLRPEFAAWRYGDQFGRRRRKNYVRVGALGLVGISVPFVQSAVSVAIGVGSLNLFPVISWSIGLYSRYRVVARVRDNAGRPLVIRAHEPEQTVILPPGPGEEWGLRINHRVVPNRRSKWWKYTRDHGQTDIRGDAAMQAAARILPLINHEGATAKEVEQAVKLASEYEDATVPFENAVRFARRSWINRGPEGLLKQVPKEMRLALEMASHEGAERRALEGELKQLEDAWREAEEIASISDDMFLPQEVSEQLADIKKRSS